MPVFITDKHLKASDNRKTYSDSKQKGFVLRTTPNGVFATKLAWLQLMDLGLYLRRPVDAAGSRPLRPGRASRWPFW